MNRLPDDRQHLSDEKRLAQLLLEAGDSQPILASREDLTNRAKLEEAIRCAVEKMRPKAPEIWRKLQTENPIFAHVIEDLARKEEADLYQVVTEWIVQRLFFGEIGKHFQLESVDHFPETQPDCVLVLTRSSSIIIAEKREPSDGNRGIEYIQISSRRPNWTAATSFRVSMDPLRVGERARFGGDFMSTSPVQNILVLPAGRTSEIEVIQDCTVAGVRATTIAARRPTGEKR